MLRLTGLALLVLSSGCATTRARLVELPGTSTTERADARCGDVRITRTALGSRWGEFLRVRVDNAATVFGQARLRVGSRVEKERTFIASGRELVLETRWTNEKSTVASALARGAALEVTLTGLTPAEGGCGALAFSVEQGAVGPDIDEARWLALLQEREGVATPPAPAARTTQAQGRARLVAASARRPARGSDPKDWVAWDDAEHDTSEWAPWPYTSRFGAPTVGSALAKGAWLALNVLPASARSRPEALARQHGVGDLFAPERLAALVELVRSASSSDEAAARTLFGGAREPVAMTLMLATAFSLGWPVPDFTEVSSPFGLRTHPLLGGERLHTGLDLSVPEGTPIAATGDGVVVRAGETKVNGRYLVIDHGHGVTTAYLHNSRVMVREGQRVSAGDFVALSGNTGRSTGPHLHYQLELQQHPVDPLYFRAAPRSSGANLASR